MYFRADYWKSNDRKFCDFCKCWIADNKPSIAFHEGGKKHKANVERKLNEISKKSAQDEKIKQKMDYDIRRMEEAAYKAYANDVANMNINLSTEAKEALAYLAHTEAKSVATPTIETKGNLPGPSALPKHAIDPLRPPPEVLEEDEQEKRDRMRKQQSQQAAVTENSLWCEAKSEEGHTYYWHIKTGGILNFVTFSIE